MINNESLLSFTSLVLNLSVQIVFPHVPSNLNLYVGIPPGCKFLMVIPNNHEHQSAIVCWCHQSVLDQVYMGRSMKSYLSKAAKLSVSFLWFSAKWILDSWVLAKWILDWGHQEPWNLLLKGNKLWHMLMESCSLSHGMFMSWNEIHSGEQMVQAFQWVDEIVRRLKAAWFIDCAQVFCGASLEVPWNKGLPYWTCFTSALLIPLMFRWFQKDLVHHLLAPLLEWT